MTVISVIYIVLIVICILGIGMGMAAIAPVLKVLCHIFGYLIVIGSIGICISDMKTSAGKTKSVSDKINMFTFPIFNILLFSMANAVFVIPIYAECMGSFKTLGDSVLSAIGLLIFVPVIGGLVLLAMIPYFKAAFPEKKKSRKWLTVSGIVSAALLILVWYCIAYYGDYRDGIPNDSLQELNAAFQILPPGIRQVIQKLLMLGGEAVRHIIF